MPCCPPGRGGKPLVPETNRPRSVAGEAPADAPPRIRFERTRSFVGTDNPVIVVDGEGPARPITLAAYALDAVNVTNARFAAFVAATGYVTEAERFGWSTVFRALLPDGAAFQPTAGPTPWWVRVDGAQWRMPEGPGSDIENRLDHPVVQVSWNDALAFADWAGGRLPDEAEWEHAARGGLADPRFPWGDEEPDDARIRCNIWQGHFPNHNTAADGYSGTSPVSAFEPNGAGLFDMAGNVWEWNADAFRVRSLNRVAKVRNAAALAAGDRLLKGGSFLCHVSYCYRYRIAARSSASPDTATSNIGFRLAYTL